MSADDIYQADELFHREGFMAEQKTNVMRVLEQKNISVTRRREMGDDIEGACGQLRRRYLKDQKPNEKE